MFIAKQIVDTISDRCHRQEKWQRMLQIYKVPAGVLPHEIADHVVGAVFAAALDVVSVEEAIESANVSEQAKYMRSCRIDSLREVRRVAHRRYATLVRLLRPFKSELEIAMDFPADPVELVRRRQDSAQREIMVAA
jgi:hypothetical protein